MSPRRPLDHTGQTFGKWTVLGRAHMTHDGQYWLCRCACSAEHAVSGRKLRSGQSKQCAACAIQALKGPDITGRVYGMWTVLYELPRSPTKPSRRRWLCRCSCGRERSVGQDTLTRGRSSSCRPCATIMARMFPKTTRTKE